MKETGTSAWSLGGGVAASVAASLCCIGPAVTLGLGLGGFTASAWFERWRPGLLGLACLLLGTAWILTWRRRRHCSRDGACARPAGRGQWTLLILATIMSLGAAVYPWLATQRLDTAPPSEITHGLARLRVAIPSMDCAACASGIAATLRRRSGVEAATIDYSSKLAVIDYAPATVTRNELLAAIDATGFPADRASIIE